MNTDTEEHLDWVRLDTRAITYFEEQLSLDSQFCRMIRSTIDLADGDCSTLLPRSSGTDRAYRFDEGDLLEENRKRFVPTTGGLLPVATLRERQAARVAAFVRSDPRAVCLIDDAAARPTDYATLATAYATKLGDETIYRLDHHASPDDIRSALARGNQIWHGLVAFCLPARTIDGHRDLSPPVLSRYLETVMELQAVAYDGEGFVTWKRREWVHNK